MIRSLWAIAVLFLCLPQPKLHAESPIEFTRDIRPILSDKCFACHGPDAKNRQGGFRLDRKEPAFGQADSGLHPIVPGDIEASELVARITSDDESMRMPPAETNKILSDHEIAVIKQWINEGASWEEHWAFLPIQRAPLPEVKQTDWLQNEIDRFILARLAKEGLGPSAPADKRTLIRRVTFDLTGLPPTLEEIDTFLADDSPQAYERLVDRLLDSPHYGEHQARYWLDAARYGDTHGLHLDNYREMWPYRDWVVTAFNNNMPFDQFAIEQLAGDLLPDPTEDQIVATGFNRCHVTTNEGGSITEEVYVRNVVDRVVTTGTVFMGMTFECTRCHDHKYDPFTMRDFYSLFAFFNNLDGNAMDGNAAQHPPVVTVLTPAAARRMPEIQAALADVQAKIDDHKRQLAESDAFAAWQTTAAADDDRRQPLPAEPFGHWPLDAGQGEQVTAAQGSDVPAGKIEGAVKWQDGRQGQALDLDGKTFVDLGDLANWQHDQSFSYGAWVKPGKNSGGAVLSRMDDGNQHRGYDLYITGDRVAAHIIHSWPDHAVKVTTKKKLKKNQWQHVFVTYDGSGKAAGVQVYIDGRVEEVEVNADKLNGSIQADVSLRLAARTPGALYQGGIDEVWMFARALTPEEVGALAELDPIGPILALAPDQRSDEQKDQLLTHYLAEHDATYQQWSKQLADWQKREAETKAEAGTTLVFRERAEPRPAYVLNRGEYDQRLDEVPRATPPVFPQMPDGAPLDRLGFARWLVDPRHPLTSRVAVNRFWQQLFGVGIVKTAEDFGSQGEPPSHPQLLDWLSRDFMDSGWDVKRLMKQLVMSAAYRQSSRVTPELYKRDPGNRLLARGPRHRLDAEMLRDQALAVSGLLVDQQGGPSVKPPQPDGLWFAVGYSGSNTVRFRKDEGPDKVYRRTLYSFIKRTAPPPQMSTFDAPSREACIVRRERTNTPLQALLLLNDPQYVEAARALAERTMRETPSDAHTRAAHMFRLCTARFPEPDELSELAGLYQEQLAEFNNDLESAQQLTKVGESAPDDQMQVAELAAWTIVANLILNLDEVLTKE